MVYRRKSNRKYRPRYRRKVPRNIKKYVKRAIARRPELKFVDVNSSDAGVMYATQRINNGITQGDGVGQRDGNKCTMVNYQMRNTIQLDPTTSYETNAVHVRELVVYFPNAQNVAGANPYTYFENVVFHDTFLPKQDGFKYKVLHDRTFTLDGGNNHSIIRKFGGKLNLPIEYDGATTLRGTLYCFYNTMSVSGGIIDEPSFTMSSRLNFRDY